MKKCKICGGACTLVGGIYQCDCCGATFSEDDFASRPHFEKGVVQTNRDVGADLFDRVRNGVLEINCQGKNTAWCGSGYLVSPRGYAITNAHVAADQDGQPCKNISVNLCGKQIAAKVVALADDQAGRGSGADLAIIRLATLPNEAVVLSLADFNQVHTGERVFVLGNSLGDGTCITSGIVSDRSRKINGKMLLMTDCAINGGNSGGPIFNAEGKVIGTICSSRIQNDGKDTEGMNYAVPIDIVEAFIEKSGIIL